MDIDLLNRLLEVGEKLKPTTFTVKEEPSHVYFQRSDDGVITRKHAEPMPRQHYASDLTTIARIATQYEDSEIWFSRTLITLFLEGDTRRETVKLPLELSPQIQRLLALEASKPSFQQVALIKELRITFGRCLGPAGNLVDVLRRVKFNATQYTDTAVEHGKASLGKQITAQVTGTGVLPEEFTIDVPVFSNANLAGIIEPITLALEPDASTATFQIIPLPGMIERAIATGEAEIGRMIEDALKKQDPENAVPVYYGKA